MVLAIIVSPYMGIDEKGGFQFIQEMTGLVSPGVFAAFSMGFFWKRTNSAGALFAIVGGFLLALAMHFTMEDIPFLTRMGYVFLICVTVMIILGLSMPDEKKGLEIDASMFKTSTSFAIGASIIVALIVFLYGYFW
jgi:SSS family solute:Na+ symporter